ncbi:MAG: PaaI family thioesterase [Reyranellaceae bacterium]
MSVSQSMKPAAPGVVPLEKLKQLSGLELLQGMRDGINPQAPIGHEMEFSAETVELGRVVFVGSPSRRFYNPIGTVHGGYALTLLDSCMSCAVHTHLPAGKGYTTIEVKTNFVRAMSDKTGPVRAEGKSIQVGQRIGTAEGRITDGKGNLIAFGTTTCLILDL